MVLHISLVGKSNHSPPTRLDLLEKLRRFSPRAYHATRSYLWTEDNLFTNLSPVKIITAVAPKGDCDCCYYYAFKADLSCGGNNEDVRVVAMLLLDLTAAVEEIAAIITEQEDVGEEDVSDVLLVELADVVEQSEERRRAYLRRWAAEEHNYHRKMVNRVVLSSGDLFILPLSLPYTTFIQNESEKENDKIKVSLAFLSLDKETKEHCRERELTEALHDWANGVERVMREESWHLAIVSIPASVAELINVYPHLVQKALLHHSVREPLHWLQSGTLASISSSHAEDIVRVVIQEYRILVQNNRYVRVPLRMPRYTFAHFYCTSIPPSLRSEPLVVNYSSNTQKNNLNIVTDEKEVLLGLQLTIALHRLRCEVPGSHKEVIEQFLKDLQRRNDETSMISNVVNDPNDVLSQRRLNRLRRRMMPVASMQGHSTDWMRTYAQEAARMYDVTDKEFARFDENMLNSSESDSSSQEENNTDKYESDDDTISTTEDEIHAVEREIEEMEPLLEAKMREAVLGRDGVCSGNENETAALAAVAENVLFRETVQMLAHDDDPCRS
ncbi:uncharacterized protein TM35_000072840 [Trypanosoma theileri]|uniref:Uncharacterized protein n=1 Tax=Trypanosoma theileri TaxID=67003 RepID=A0A1X0P374_9TRYP|nr:uncharacterized protein TM35_000072840 [Trypanosoma theileri]ORC90860.1 hypothetical protein TM35_000072840 [Trypanosoma theileri]